MNFDRPGWSSRTMTIALLTSGLMLTCLPASAQAYQPSFRPSELKGPVTGLPNEVLVLGTPHLSELPDTFSADVLDPLLDRLAAWRPTAIATEDLSGLQCDTLRRYPFRYAETVKIYCFDPMPAEQAIGLTVPEANAEAERLLHQWPANPLPAQRRELAAVFLAAGEPGSALVQWLRLSEDQRMVGDGLNQDLVTTLERARARRNETTMIAAALAAQLGLERLWSVDDHSADTPDRTEAAEAQASSDAIAKAWDNPATHARIAQTATLNAQLDQPDGLMNLYRAYNEPDAPMLVYRSDFGAAVAEPSPQGFGRQYVGYWETRNLRMVANMRDVIGRNPGTRLLTIVGASHKGYYEAYLHQMHDVRLADTMMVLR